ncbi:MAG TPA: efflux transporter outer membrane subunit [Luteitalea sp.]|nr:efflux transporter outer membrane subunit [Luteitalea sp.]
MRIGSFAAVVAALVFTAACAERRVYVAPDTAPPTLAQATGEGFSAQPYDARWWTQFDDPVLVQLQDAALAANQDVKAAVARVDQARAVFDDVRRDRYPTVPVNVSVDRREQAIPGFVNEPIRTSTYRAAFDATWEIDIFGRVRSAIRAAQANAESLDASLEDIKVIVTAEVAREYFDLRGVQQQLAVAERSLANQRETLRLTQVRRTNGIGEEQDVASAAARVAAIEASIPPLRARVATSIHRLAVLNGVRPADLAVNLAPRPYPVLAKELPLGDVGQLLRRRPDVRVAERRLAAAAAREGVAAAELYPRVTISGVLGLLAGRGSVFGTSDSRAWAVTPALSWAGFDLGSARARLRGAEAASRESLATYEQAVLLAIEETENALVAYREEQARLVKLGDQARESERAANIARIRFREGLSDFLTLLDAERTQLAAQDAVARAEADVFIRVVALYKSLGGVTI